MAIILGQYVPGKSPVHRLDPRTKIALTALLTVIVFAVRGWWGFAAFFIFTGIVAWAAGLPLGYLLRGMRPMFFFAAITFLFQLVFVDQGQELWRWGFFRVTDRGWQEAWFMSFRLLLVISVVLLMTLTTSPIELSEGIERLFRPLRVVGVNSYEIGLVAAGALRFVPTLLEQADKVKRAQMARGVDFERGSLIARGRKLFPLLMPLLLNAIRRAEDLGVAMEARCYRGGIGRVSLRESRTGPLDYAAYLLVAAFSVILLWVRL